jgi:hypothetical protein
VKGKVFYYGTSAFSENANDAAKNFTKIKWSNSDALNNKTSKFISMENWLIKLK